MFEVDTFAFVCTLFDQRYDFIYECIIFTFVTNSLEVCRKHFQFLESYVRGLGRREYSSSRDCLAIYNVPLDETMKQYLFPSKSCTLTLLRALLQKFLEG